MKQTWTAPKFQEFMDRFSFQKIFLVWIGIILIFGALYITPLHPSAKLIETDSNQIITNYDRAVYFSFITATTTGFGDIRPVGFYRVIAVIEVILGLLLLSVVTSKLVSLKQNTIIEELYEITLIERVNRVRSTLLYTRQTMKNLIHHIEDKSFKQRDIVELYQQFQQLQDIFREVHQFFRTSKNSPIKRIDHIQAGLVLNSVNDTLHRIQELLQVCTAEQIKWETERNKKQLNACLKKAQQIMDSIAVGSSLDSDTVKEFRGEHEKIQGQILSLSI